MLPPRSYCWRSRDGVCWVPLTNLLLTVNMSITVTGLQYNAYKLTKITNKSDLEKKTLAVFL